MEIELEIFEILNDKLKPKPQVEVHLKKPAIKIWLPTEVIPSTLLIEYSQTLIQKPSKRICDVAHRIYSLLAVSKDEELNSLVKEFRSVTGLNLPTSNKDNIMMTLKNMVGQTSKIHELLSLRREILIEKIIDKKKTLVLNLKEAERQINLIADSKQPIKVSNDYDLELFPCQLTYVNKTITFLVEVPVEVSIHCECENHCSSSCVHLELEREFRRKDQQLTEPYDKNGKILYPNKNPVFECNKYCKCDESCPRRVVQKGPNIRLEIFRTFNDCGWGIRTLEFISKGTLVTKYTGELILWEEGDRRQNREYLFDNNIDVCPTKGHSIYTTDAFNYGNVARFANHSCEANLVAHVVYIDNVHLEMGEIVFFSERDIEAFEELTINYYGLVKSQRGKCRCAVCCSR